MQIVKTNHACGIADGPMIYPSDLVASVPDGFRGAQARGEDSEDEEKQRQCSGTRHGILHGVGSLMQRCSRHEEQHSCRRYIYTYLVPCVMCTELCHYA
jgi:hypothetical protein